MATEPFCTWRETRDRAQQGHLLLVHISTVANNSHVWGWRRGGGGGEDWLVTSFSLDGSIRSWLFKPACLEKEQTWGKGGRGGGCSREVAVVHFGCHSQWAGLASSEQTDERKKRKEGKRKRDSEREKQTEGQRESKRHYQRELSESLAVAPLSRSVSCGAPPPSLVCFSAVHPVLPHGTTTSLICSLSTHRENVN